MQCATTTASQRHSDYETRVRECRHTGRRANVRRCQIGRPDDH